MIPAPALVAFGPPRSRSVALRLAARFGEAGVPAVLVPSMRQPGAFDVAIAPNGAPLRSLPGPGLYRVAAPPDEEATPLRARRLAAFFALGVGFGLGHLYARETLSALILAVAQAGCLVLACLGVEAALYAIPGLVLLDALGAVRAVDRENEGERRDGPAQLARTLPVAALLLATTTILAHEVRPHVDSRALEASP